MQGEFPRKGRRVVIDRDDGRNGLLEAAYTLELTPKRYRLVRERCAAKGHPPPYLVEEILSLAACYTRVPSGSYHTDGVVWRFQEAAVETAC